MPGNLNAKKLVKQIGDFAERVEHTSEDVRKASSQAKRVTKELS